MTDLTLKSFVLRNSELLSKGTSLDEKGITLDYFLDRMESMQRIIADLQRELACVKAESQARISDLETENNEYKRALIQIREYNTDQEVDLTSRKDSEPIMDAHLEMCGKILVIGGQELGTNVMSGIAKTMGFEKKDFEFIDYDKVKGYTERIISNGKFCAVIIGACPHKTSDGAGYSSLVERLKQTDGMPFTTEARSKSGKLKMTKESFRTALKCVYDYLSSKSSEYVEVVA